MVCPDFPPAGGCGMELGMSGPAKLYRAGVYAADERTEVLRGSLGRITRYVYLSVSLHPD